MAQDDALRKQLVAMLRKSEAHAGFDRAVENFPAAQRGTRPEGSPHSAWELLEHIRLAQRDILEFSESANYVETNWPDDYWPKSPDPATPGDWDRAVKAVVSDREMFIKLLNDPHRDLNAPFPWGKGQTLLREALLIIDHNAYHVGEIVLLRRVLGIWS